MVSTTGDGLPAVPRPWSATTVGLLQRHPPSVERERTISVSDTVARRVRRAPPLRAKATSVPPGVRTTDGIRYQRWVDGFERKTVAPQAGAAFATAGAAAADGAGPP
ncbi:MAG: hypothetical protein ACRYG2_20300 [Janthinobacterium lividum]